LVPDEAAAGDRNEALGRGRALLLGDVRTLPPDEQEAFRAMDIDAGYGDRAPGVPSGRVAVASSSV
jgi:hypothetical protein